MRFRVALAVSASCASSLAMSNPAAAQAGSESDGSDIIVTARRVEENLQDVPISITVFNQEALSNRNVITATDLANYTPSLSVNSRYGPEKASFAIRGFVQEPSTAPSVGTYFAEVVAPSAFRSRATMPGACAPSTSTSTPRRLSSAMSRSIGSTSAVGLVM